MNYEHETYQMARDMLGVEYLEQRLVERIARVIELAETCGCDLASRQTLATIIMQWEIEDEKTAPKGTPEKET